MSLEKLRFVKINRSFFRLRNSRKFSKSQDYYLQDHLGNNRVVCNASGTVEQVNHYYPFGGLFGQSTNGDTQRYKYNGKELDRMHGLE